MEKKPQEVVDALEKKLKTLPTEPGVYLMKNELDKVIYVGKAKNLRNRVRSYFRQQPKEAVKTKALVRHIYDFEFLLVDTETEALILESTLIKKYKPKYNINLKDDKSYPYVRITNEPFPRIFVTRRVIRDGSHYFGPYPNVYDLRHTLEMLQRLFRFRTCANSRFNKHEGCLNMHIKRCDAPCVGKISQEEYLEKIQSIRRFFQGHIDDLLRQIEKEMQQAAQALEFEKAARLRDDLQGLKKLAESQKTELNQKEDRDVLAMARSGSLAVVHVFFIRRGRILGRERYPLHVALEEREDAILDAFLTQFYTDQEQVPPRIDVDRNVPSQELLATYLSEKHQHKVRFHVPQRGEAKSLVAMVTKNAHDDLLRRQDEKEREKARTLGALEDLSKSLHLKEAPSRIECYDISNTQGTNSVASMVVMHEGKPQKSAYRRFKIKTVEGPNDFASMHEVITRRFLRAKEGDEKFLPLPDLVIIDGGPGQLSYARRAMRETGFDAIPTFGLAKQEELLFKENEKLPYVLPRESNALHLIQRLRDESHRFAITFHRSLRGKKQLASVLDDIPGVGKKRKASLLTHFGSFSKIENASIDELAAVEGISQAVAETIYHYLKEHQDLQARIKKRQQSLTR